MLYRRNTIAVPLTPLTPSRWLDAIRLVLRERRLTAQLHGLRPCSLRNNQNVTGIRHGRHDERELRVDHAVRQPQLSWPSLHRCLQRRVIDRLPDVEGDK